MELLICEMVHFGCLHAGILLICIMRALLLGPHCRFLPELCMLYTTIVVVVTAQKVGVDMSQVIMHIQYICVIDAVRSCSMIFLHCT